MSTKHLLSILSLATLFVVAFPAPVMACGLLDIDCHFGWTERAEVREAEATQRTQIEAQRDAEVARIEADAAEAERLHSQQLEAQRQAGQLSAEQARQQAESFRTMVQTQAQTEIRQIDANYALMAQSLTEQAEIAQAGIQESGLTERTRITLDGHRDIALVVVLGLLLAIYLYGRQRRELLLTLRPNDHPLFPPQDSGEIVDSTWKIIRSRMDHP